MARSSCYGSQTIRMPDRGREAVPTPVLLIAEDDDDHADLLELALEDAPIQCTLIRVRNGEEAIQYLHREGSFADAKTPDLILLDINMPRVNGLEVAEFIKGSDAFRHIPTVILTTSDADPDKRKAYALGVNSFLVKPADFGEMTDMLSDVLKYWTRWNRPAPSD